MLIAVARGEMGRFDTFVDRHRTPLLGYCHARLRDRALAEDVTQETFLRAFRYAARHGVPPSPESDEAASEGGGLRAWLVAIARNCVHDHLRAKRRRPLRLVGDEALDRVDGRGGPQEEASKVELRERLLEAMETLPDEQAEVVRLRLHGELTTLQMAQVLGIPEGTVKSRMRYATAKLREALCGQENAI